MAKLSRSTLLVLIPNKEFWRTEDFHVAPCYRGFILAIHKQIEDEKKLGRIPEKNAALSMPLVFTLSGGIDPQDISLSSRLTKVISEKEIKGLFNCLYMVSPLVIASSIYSSITERNLDN